MKNFTMPAVILLVAAMLLTSCTTQQEQASSSANPASSQQETKETQPDVPTLHSTDQKFLEQVDVDYSHNLALRLTQIRSNEKLGYRTAGSAAELATGDLLAAEMESIGLQNVTKDEFTLDTWDFHHAELSFTAPDGTSHTAVLGGYQTQFDTKGSKEFTVVYGGQGTESDLAKLDVTGKLVLIDINQRENWWINYPAMEAHLAGAVGVLAAQDGGYSEISDDALNAQDICGPADAPAFSISRTDANLLKSVLANTPEAQTTVTFDAQSTVGLDGKSYNIVGTIPGRSNDKMILMSAHYDSYFDGFQDDNAAIALMMGIAKAIVDSGYKPEKTLVFCALAAEEWGVSNTRYDWSTGAYNQIFRVRPEWAGKVMANINFELPAYNFDFDTTQMRTSYELKTFAEAFSKLVPNVDGAFPAGTEIIVPTQTWSDDFSFSIAGIPASVNNLRDDFAKQYYHTQFDDKDTYSQPAFQYHHNLYGMMMLAYDRCAVAPLDFTERFAAIENSISPEQMALGDVDASALRTAATAAKEAADAAYTKLSAVNDVYASAVDASDFAAADQILVENENLYSDILAVFKQAEDDLVRLTWEDVSSFPHELPAANLDALHSSKDALESGNAQLALDEFLFLVDNNWYAYDWSRATYNYFTDYVLTQSPDRLMWGAGRIVGHEDLFEVIRSLQQKADQSQADFSQEIATLDQSIQRQKTLLQELTTAEIQALNSLTTKLNAIM